MQQTFHKKHPTKIQVGDVYALKQGWQGATGSTRGDIPAPGASRSLAHGGAGVGAAPTHPEAEEFY